MKTGEPKQRLSEKLNADLEQMRRENAALMEAQLQSFRDDLKTTAESGLAIIKTDMETYLLSVRKHLMIQSNQNRKPAPQKVLYMMGVSLCVMISSCLSVWAIWTILQPKESYSGVRPVMREEATYLVPITDQVSIAQCRLGSRTVDCLKIEGS